MAEKNKLKTPSRFYHDVGKFVPEVPAPGATFAGHENHQKETVRPVSYTHLTLPTKA